MTDDNIDLIHSSLTSEDIHRLRIQKRIEDIKANPEKHKHDFNGLQQCCMIDGVLVLQIMDAHSKYVSLGSNGGTKCDVTKGPCSCGAWH